MRIVTVKSVGFSDHDVSTTIDIGDQTSLTPGCMHVHKCRRGLSVRYDGAVRRTEALANQCAPFVQDIGLRCRTGSQRWNLVSGSRVTGSAILVGSGRSRVSVSDPLFDPVLSFNMRVYRGVVSTE